MYYTVRTFLPSIFPKYNNSHEYHINFEGGFSLTCYVMFNYCTVLYSEGLLLDSIYIHISVVTVSIPDIS